MGFFATFWTWLNGQLANYIGTNTARVAEALEPAIVTLATLYVMVWGYLHLTGRIDEPFIAGLKRLVTLAVVLGGALHLWLYNSLIVDTFYQAPAQLAAAVVGAPDPVAAVDAIWNRGGAVAGSLWNIGAVFSLPVPNRTAVGNLEASKLETLRALVDLKRLFDLWVEHYDKIPEVQRRLLPIRPVYFLIPSE